MKELLELVNLMLSLPAGKDVAMWFVCWLLLLMVVFLICITLFWIYESIYDHFDKKNGSSIYKTGVLIDKKYVGESSESGVGTAIVPNTNGGVGIGIVSTSSHQDEQFLFFIKEDKIYKIDVDMQAYYAFNVGQTVKFSVLMGAYSKEQLDITFIR